MRKIAMAIGFVYGMITVGVYWIMFVARSMANVYVCHGQHCGWEWVPDHPTPLWMKIIIFGLLQGLITFVAFGVFFAVDTREKKDAPVIEEGPEESELKYEDIPVAVQQWGAAAMEEERKRGE